MLAGASRALIPVTAISQRELSHALLLFICPGNVDPVSLPLRCVWLREGGRNRAIRPGSPQAWSGPAGRPPGKEGHPARPLGAGQPRPGPRPGGHCVPCLHWEPGSQLVPSAVPPRGLPPPSALRGASYTSHDQPSPQRAWPAHRASPPSCASWRKDAGPGCLSAESPSELYLHPLGAEMQAPSRPRSNPHLGSCGLCVAPSAAVRGGCSSVAAGVVADSPQLVFMPMSPCQGDTVIYRLN